MDTHLALVQNAKTILLTTYKRDGTPVATPVSIAFTGDRAFFRSYDKAWKTRRLKNNAHVELAASTLRGKATEPQLPARAVLLEGEQARVAARALARRHPVLQGLLVPVAHRVLGYRTMHYELHADPAQAASQAVGGTAHQPDADRRACSVIRWQTHEEASICRQHARLL